MNSRRAIIAAWQSNKTPYTHKYKGTFKNTMRKIQFVYWFVIASRLLIRLNPSGLNDTMN
jgi:hypothetical protein